MAYIVITTCNLYIIYTWPVSIYVGQGQGVDLSISGHTLLVFGAILIAIHVFK